MTNTIVNVRDLSVHYGAAQVLHDLTFDIAAGEVTGLLGPNGAGKTTLVKTLCGKIKPSAGAITLCGHAVKQGSENRKAIGFVPQDIGLYPHLTARENLDVFARMLGIAAKARKAAVDKALETVGLTHRHNHAVGHLSGGMKRRINYAAAILHDPKLLILDEPTAGVDIPNRDAVHQVTKALTARGMAVLLITHELEQAEMICDRVLMLVGGKMYGFDTPKGLLGRHYGDQCECLVTLEANGDLSAHGFAPTEMAHVWRKTVDASAGMDDLRAALSKGGHDVREITLRRPGLPALMHAIEAGQAA